MSRLDHIILMASYNTEMNAKLYAAAAQISAEEIQADKGAYFTSILGTLNHIVVADTVWLKRFAAHPSQHLSLAPMQALPSPERLDQLLFTDLPSLTEHRHWLDGVINAWAKSLTEADLSHVLHYANMKGIAANKNFFSLVMHFFNHQTHHRGQATTLLSQQGIDVGVTDLLELIPNQAAE
ncbi:DinB family protein [Methylomonas sp. AM2-LC]|uniref:DinB family protein n=1 Tax=Methylomonas sp. AM2-LC TaxID=3153301 RepID=UPI0032659F32